ncbi:MAG: AbrB/MazE/SpoVT family DNA-binding domain-containing protein [Candidatus Syntrophoarchaeum sp.]|nr:AbrB/MazE/SpoVT family DNA-binding domain-containing protein [Methanomicrobia archaeon]MBL7117170.1 AbrB/MazE/SpoVT family DNA-binding domain-containing protein [Candidatus Syntrophoarchaeum sp.]
MEKVIEKIKPYGEIRIPKGFLDILGVKTGESVELTIADKKVLIEPSKDPIKSLRGLVKLDKETSKKIIESPEFEPL